MVIFHNVCEFYYICIGKEPVLLETKYYPKGIQDVITKEEK